MASPSKIGTDTSFSTANATSVTQAHTVPTTGQNRALIVMSFDNSTPTSVTYAGTGMTAIVDLTAVRQGKGVMFYLANPSTGTNNIVMNWAEARNTENYAFTLQDIVQSSPVDVTVQGDTASGTSVSKDITTNVDGDLIISWIETSNLADSFAANSPQTMIFSKKGSSGSYLGFAISYLAQSTAGLVNTGFTWTTASSADIYVTSLKYLAPAKSVRLMTMNVGS